MRYSAAIVFNRLIPAWLFRFRRFNIYRISTRSSAHESRSPNPDSTSATPASARFAWAKTETEFQAAEQLSGFQRTMSPPPGTNLACLAFRDETVVGVAWLAATQFDEPELGSRIVLAANHFWIFSTYIESSCRRQGIYRALLNFATEDLRKENPNAEFLLAINPINHRSIRAHQSRGIKLVSGAVAIRSFGLAFGGSRDIPMSRRLTWKAATEPIEFHMPSDSNNLDN